MIDGSIARDGEPVLDVSDPVPEDDTGNDEGRMPCR